MALLVIDHVYKKRNEPTDLILYLLVVHDT